MWAAPSPNLAQPSNRRSFRAKSPTVESRSSINGGGTMANTAKNTSSSRTGSIKSFSEAATATKGLRRFGQSIKRVVREVKEQDNSVSESRDTLVERYNRAAYASRILSEAYQVCLSQLVTLHNSYIKSKEEKNVVTRYSMMREMIKNVVKLESAWWAVAEMPEQNRKESIQDYVLRVCGSIESLRIPFDANAFRETQKEKDERIETVNEMTSKQLSEHLSVKLDNTHKMLKQYTEVKQIIHTLGKSYGESKLYPMFPRYNLLKEMIKEVTHHPDYMEHRHESKVQPV